MKSGTNSTIIRTLTNRSFKANRGRNLVAVCAIVLTAVMFTSLFVISQSMVQNMREMNFKQAGYTSPLSFGPMTGEDADILVTHKSIAAYGKSMVLSIAENDELSGRQTEIRYADEYYAKTALSLPTTGRLPETADEIALDSIVLDKLGIPHEIGQPITLKWRKDLTGNDYITTDFVLSGFWEGNPAAIASMAWVSKAFADRETAGVDVSAQLANGKFFGVWQLHVDMPNDRNLEQVAEMILNDTGLLDVSSSINIAYSSGVSQSIIAEVIPMIIGMLLVFVSGYLIIYNIFQISVAADIRFYGKLKTLGGSKKQITRMIYGQANRLCLIGIPVGLILGYLIGAWLVPFMIAGTGVSAAVYVNPIIFIGSALFAYGTVLISCLKPASVAGKVSPMEALRYTDSGTNSHRKVKKSKQGAGIFRMAFANLGRNKKRTFTVICSLTLGFTLLTALNAKNSSFDLDKYMGAMVISDFEVRDSSIAGYFGRYNPRGTTISQDLSAKIETLPGLISTGRLYSQLITHEINPSAMANIEAFYNANGRLQDIQASDPGLAEAYDDMVVSGDCRAVLYGIDGLIPDTFSEEHRIVDGIFDKTRFSEGGYVIAQAVGGAEESEKETQPTYSVGDTVLINGMEFEVMCIVADITPITEGPNGEKTFLSFYLPCGIFQGLYPENTMRKLFFNVDEGYQEEAEIMLKDYQDGIDKTLNYKSKATLIEHYKDQTRASTIMGFSISIIIAIVGILNFINSMVTAIVSRQKEFAMLQSIGMTKRQLRNMLICEGVDYAAFTLALSFLLGILTVGIGVRAMVSGDWTSTFNFNITPLFICIPILFAFAALIPYICFRNLEKQSAVEKLRNTD